MAGSGFKQNNSQWCSAMIELIKAGTLFVLGRNPRSDKNFFFLTASNFSFACSETNFWDGPNGACFFLVLGAALVVVFDWTAPVGSAEVFCCLVRGTLGSFVAARFVLGLCLDDAVAGGICVVGNGSMVGIGAGKSKGTGSISCGVGGVGWFCVDCVGGGVNLDLDFGLGVDLGLYDGGGVDLDLAFV